MEELREPAAIRIFVDADACPVKAETYRVAERYGLHVYVVANAFMAVPRSDWIERVIVPEGPDVATIGSLNVPDRTISSSPRTFRSQHGA